MASQRLSLEEFKKIFSKVPRLCVELIIKSDKGILFTKRAIPPLIGTWHIPGGGVLFEETLENAAKRVARDELGVEIKLGPKIGNIEFLGEEDKNYIRHSVSVVFLAEILSGEVKLNNEATEFIFTKKILENTYPEHKDFLLKHKELFQDSKLY